MVQPTEAELQAHLPWQSQLLMGLAAALDDNAEELNSDVLLMTASNLDFLEALFLLLIPSTSF
jgi:hypothetical protein